MSARPVTHTVLYGPPGSGKTYFAASCPTPMLVFLFDLPGKETAYLEQGAAYDLRGDSYKGYDVSYVFEKNKKGEEDIRIEHWYDEDPGNPVCFKEFQKRIIEFTREHEYEDYATVVLDSLTFMQAACIREAQRINPKVKDIRRLYMNARFMLEPILMNRLGSLPCNVVLTAHERVDQDDESGRVIYQGPAAPGQLKNNLGAGYTELYHTFTRKRRGDVEYLMQTRGDRHWPAMSTVAKAPDPCWNDYESIWEDE